MQRPGQRPLSARGNVPVVGARQKDPHDDFRGAPREGAKLGAFHMESIISKGAFGKVYRAVRRSDGMVFALKQVDFEGMKRNEREEALDEARMLSRVNHPNVIRYYDAFLEDNKLNIVMEYAAGGTLHALVRKGPRGQGVGLPEERVWAAFLQSLVGLAHLHARKIIHRDIKSLNLFLDDRGIVKVGDLGIARALSAETDFARTIVGTPYYLSPELCEDKPYNEKSDIWALGVVLYEMMAGRHPFEAQNEGALIRKIMRGQYDPPPASYSAPLRDLLRMCLTHSPDRRPDSRTLLALPSLRTKARELGISLQVDPATNPDGPPRGMPPERQPAYEEHPRRGGAYDAGHGRERREGAREGRWAGVGGAPGGGGGAWRDGGAPRGVVPERWDGAVREVEEGRGGREARGGAEGALERNRYVARDMGETPTREEYLARAAYEAYERELGGRERGVGEVERRMGGMMVGRGEGVGAALRHEDGVVGAGRPRDARANPVEMPPAGRPTMGVPGVGAAAPWAMQEQGAPRFEDHRSADVAHHAQAMWTARYERPTFGRKASSDLMPAAPTTRAPPTGRVGSARAGGGARYAGPTYEPTVVSTTTATTNAPRPAPRPF